MSKGNSKLKTGLPWALLVLSAIAFVGGIIVLIEKPAANATSPNANTNISPQQPEPATSYKVATIPAPDFDVKALDGGRISLREFRGKVVVMDFWSITCGPCIDANKHLQGLYNQYKSVGFVGIGLSIDRNPKLVQKFLKTHPANYPMGLATDKVIQDYGGAAAIPKTFIIDREGNIVKKYEGYSLLMAHQLDSTVKRLLKAD